MRIAYVTPLPPDDRYTYAGTTYHIRKAFERAGADVVPIGPLESRYDLWLKSKKLAYRLGGLEFERFRSPLLLKAYAAEIERRALAARCDVAFSPIGTHVSFVRAMPFAFWGDATFGALTALYPRPRPFCAEALRNGHGVEQAGLTHARLAGFSSAWAARLAREEYEVDPARIAVVPYGANLDHPPTDDAVAAMRKTRMQRLADGRLNLLFVGREFERKGGPLAIASAKILRARGLEVNLDVIGQASRPEWPSYVTPLGFLDANREADRRTLEAAYARAHVFLLPTRADCTPMVLVEAMAYGLPSVTTDVGGVGGMLPAQAGAALPPSAPAEAYADQIEALVRPEQYAAHASAARAHYTSVLNWDVAARAYLDRLEDALR